MSIHDNFIIEVNDDLITNKELKLFETILYKVIDDYCLKFNLSLLKKVVLVKDLPNNSDGRCLKEHIEIRDNAIKKLVANINIENKERIHKTLISTIYHELCHMDTRTTMPNLYSLVDKEDDDILVALFWIEYITHIQYEYLADKNMDFKFCNDFLKCNWTKVEHQYYRMLKELSYFIARWERLNPDNFIESLSVYKSSFTKEHIESTYSICTNLMQLYPFDDYETLRPIHELFQKNADRYDMGQYY